MPFSCSATRRVYLFIHFSLIRTFAPTNAEVVALAPSLHPPSPDSQDCRSPGKEASAAFSFFSLYFFLSDDNGEETPRCTLKHAARICELTDTDLFKYIRQLIRQVSRSTKLQVWRKARKALKNRESGAEICTLQSGAVLHGVLSAGSGTPTSATPYIHSVISGNKSGALEAMGGSMKGRKESCSWSWLNRGLSHLERPVYSPSIMALIF